MTYVSSAGVEFPLLTPAIHSSYRMLAQATAVDVFIFSRSTSETSEPKSICWRPRRCGRDKPAPEIPSGPSESLLSGSSGLANPYPSTSIGPGEVLPREPTFREACSQGQFMPRSTSNTPSPRQADFGSWRIRSIHC